MVDATHLGRPVEFVQGRGLRVPLVGPAHQVHLYRAALALQEDLVFPLARLAALGRFKYWSWYYCRETYQCHTKSTMYILVSVTNRAI